MPRFFVRGAEGDTVKILGDDARHIARALRMAVGDTVTVSNCEGLDLECRLTKIRDEECECQVLSSRESAGEPPAEITLYMAYPKGDKLETVIQKAVELGAFRIVPFESSRCIKRPDRDKAERIGARLSRIAAEAAKQCGRGRLPSVSVPLGFAELLSEIKQGELTLFCYEGEGTESLKRVLESEGSVRKISVIVGCEGGFSAEEAEKIVAAGATAVNLGPRILRCETAPSYVLSVLSYYFEL